MFELMSMMRSSLEFYSIKWVVVISVNRDIIDNFSKGMPFNFYSIDDDEVIQLLVEETYTYTTELLTSVVSLHSRCKKIGKYKILILR